MTGRVCPALFRSFFIFRLRPKAKKRNFSNISLGETFVFYNHEGYHDPTVYEAFTGIEKERKQEKQAVKQLRASYAVYRPIVYICSPYAGDVKQNVQRAQAYCRFAVQKNCVPIATHLLFPQFMGDHDPVQRQQALFMSRLLMTKCNEVWVFGEAISQGMASEIRKAESRNKIIRYFTKDCQVVAAVVVVLPGTLPPVGACAAALPVPNPRKFVHRRGLAPVQLGEEALLDGAAPALAAVGRDAQGHGQQVFLGVDDIHQPPQALRGVLAEADVDVDAAGAVGLCARRPDGSDDLLHHLDVFVAAHRADHLRRGGR